MAIGLGSKTGLELQVGDAAGLVAFGTADGSRSMGFRHRKTITDLVYDGCRERTTVYCGEVVSG